MNACCLRLLNYITGWKITLFPEFSEDMNVIISTNVHFLELIKGSFCSSGRVEKLGKEKSNSGNCGNELCYDVNRAQKLIFQNSEFSRPFLYLYLPMQCEYQYMSGRASAQFYIDNTFGCVVCSHMSDRCVERT